VSDYKQRSRWDITEKKYREMTSPEGRKALGEMHLAQLHARLNEKKALAAEHTAARAALAEGKAAYKAYCAAQGGPTHALMLAGLARVKAAFAQGQSTREDYREAQAAWRAYVVAGGAAKLCPGEIALAQAKAAFRAYCERCAERKAAEALRQERLRWECRHGSGPVNTDEARDARYLEWQASQSFQDSEKGNS
jgi:hypothetical protein